VYARKKAASWLVSGLNLVPRRQGLSYRYVKALVDGYLRVLTASEEANLLSFGVKDSGLLLAIGNYLLLVG
jgi:hypothetical protein